MDQYAAVLKRGQEHANELNNRFRDWFYLISEDDYKKVHLTLSEIVKKKGASDAEPPLGPQNPFQRPHPPLFAPPER